MHIKKGDSVVVLAGKDKGSKGKVMKVMPATGRVVVEGINKWKKHQRPKTTDGKGETVEVLRSINASNVAVADPKTGKATRVATKVVAGKRVRIAQKSGQEI